MCVPKTLTELIQNSLKIPIKTGLFLFKPCIQDSTRPILYTNKVMVLNQLKTPIKLTKWRS